MLYLAAALVVLGLSLQGCGDDECQVDGQTGECQPCSSVGLSNSAECETMCRSGRIKLGCGEPGGKSDCRDQLAEPPSEWDGGSCSCFGVGDGDVKEHIRVCIGGEESPRPPPAAPAPGQDGSRPEPRDRTTSQSSRTRGGEKQKRDMGPLPTIGSFAAGSFMIVGALACLVTGKAPDKRKGCFAVSTREESPCNWYTNVGINGIVGIGIIVFGIVALAAS